MGRVRKEAGAAVGPVQRAYELLGPSCDALMKVIDWSGSSEKDRRIRAGQLDRAERLLNRSLALIAEAKRLPVNQAKW